MHEEQQQQVEAVAAVGGDSEVVQGVGSTLLCEEDAGPEGDGHGEDQRGADVLQEPAAAVT